MECLVKTRKKIRLHKPGVTFCVTETMRIDEKYEPCKNKKPFKLQNLKGFENH
jgi:hypothetical protein